MGDMALGWQNIITASATVLTAGSEGTLPIAAPASNHVQPQGHLQWRTADGVRTTTLLIDASAATAWRCISLHRSNLTGASTIRVRFGNTTSGGLHDSTALAGVVSGQYVY